MVRVITVALTSLENHSSLIFTSLSYLEKIDG